MARFFNPRLLVAKTDRPGDIAELIFFSYESGFEADATDLRLAWLTGSGQRFAVGFAALSRREAVGPQVTLRVGATTWYLRRDAEHADLLAHITGDVQCEGLLPEGDKLAESGGSTRTRTPSCGTPCSRWWPSTRSTRSSPRTAATTARASPRSRR